MSNKVWYALNHQLNIGLSPSAAIMDDVSHLHKCVSTGTKEPGGKYIQEYSMQQPVLSHTA